MDINEKLTNYLNENETLDIDDDFSGDADIMNRMYEFIVSLDSETMTEDQIEEATAIIDAIADEDMSEAISAKKVKISPAAKRQRRLEYRKNRAQLKMKAKRFRRTTKFKKYTRVKKRKARSGKTTTGKRIRKFL